jgi:hypothetical protein
MFTTKIRVAVLLILAFTTPAAAQINAYEFVVVPEKFQEFQEENQYHTSTLLKYLFKQKGFTTYYEKEVPDMLLGSCKGLKVDLLDESSMLRTRAVVVLKDCKGKEVFRTVQGDSREKDFKEGFKEAIEAAFKSIETLDYRYEPEEEVSPEAEEPLTLNFNNDVKTLQEVGKTEQQNMNRKSNPAIIQQASPEEQRFVDRRPKPSDLKSGAPATSGQPEAVPSGSPEVWYAQRLPNGYQLVDSSPQIRLRLLETSVPEIYLAENENSHGLVYKQDNRWYFEYYKDEERVVQELDIKF